MFPKETVGVREILKEFKIHKALQRHRRKLEKDHKVLWKLLQKHKDHEGLIGHVFSQRNGDFS